MNGSGERGPITVTTNAGNVRVTVTVEVGAEDFGARAPAQSDGVEHPEPRDGPRLVLGGGRDLPPLLFVTNTDKLAKQIGMSEAAFVVKMIRDAGHKVVFVHSDVAAECARLIDEELDGVEGVVIVGGYQVVPPFRIDTLVDVAQRRGVNRVSDLDHYYVWSDDRYADSDGDWLPSVPVTRIPDAQSAMVTFAQLCSSPAPAGGCYGVRNLRRTYADRVAFGPDAHEGLPTSLPETITSFDPAWVGSPLTYLVLHGKRTDATSLFGEDQQRRPVKTLTIAKLPEQLTGTFFSACCWGALITGTTARLAGEGESVPDRSELQSFAISTLARGAHAFVGCTGAHWSPPPGAMTHGVPFHLAFFDAMREGFSPAAATLAAKRQYRENYLSTITEASELAYSTKNLHAFTCLGLAW